MTNVDKKVPKFSCEKCEYVCNKPCLWIRHCNTKKHNKLTFIEVNVPPISNVPPLSNVPSISKKGGLFCECGKKYSYRQSLSVHKKKCSLTSKIMMQDNVFTNNILQKLLLQNMFLINKFMEVCIDNSLHESKQSKAKDNITHDMFFMKSYI